MPVPLVELPRTPIELDVSPAGLWPQMPVLLVLPVLIFLAVSALLAAVLLGLGAILGRLGVRHRMDAAKLSSYECGFEAFEDNRGRFDVRYYLVAILFILFDLEIAFLFPWAVVLKEIGLFGFIAMMIFLAILVVGFIYEWKKGALEWE